MVFASGGLPRAFGRRGRTGEMRSIGPIDVYVIVNLGKVQLGRLPVVFVQSG